MAPIPQPLPQAQSGLPDYTNASQGRPANRAWETLFEGIGTVAGAVAGVKDQQNMTNIQEGVYAATDAVNAEFGIPSATIVRGGHDIFGHNGPTMPDGVIVGQENLARLQEAFVSGRINQSHYWARLNNQVQMLRSQYPGYRAEIDDMVSSIVGGNPANRLRDEMFQEYNSLISDQNANANAWENWVNTNAEWIDLAIPDFFARQRAGNPYTDIDWVKEQTNRARGNHQANIVETTELGLAAARGEANQEQAYSVGTRLVNDAVDTMLNQFINMSGTGSANESVMQTIFRMQEEGSVPEAELQQLKAAFAQARFQVMNSVRTLLNQQLPDSEETLASILGDQGKVDELIAIAEGRLSDIEKMINDEDFGLIGLELARAQAMGDRAYRILLEEYPVLQTSEAMRRIGGEQFLNQLMMTSQPWNGGEHSFLRDLTVAMREISARGIMSGEAQTMNDIMDDFAAARVSSPEAYRAVLADAVTAITSPETPDGVRLRYAEAMFAPGNEDFLNNFPVTDQKEIFNQFITPEISTQMLAMKERNPELWENYAYWAAESFQRLFQNAFADVMVGERVREKIDLEWDAETGQIVVVPTEAGPMYRSWTPTGFIENILTKPVVDAVNEINRALQNMAPIFEAEGLGGDEFLQYILQAQGVNLNAPQENSGADNLEWFLGEALQLISPFPAASTGSGIDIENSPGGVEEYLRNNPDAVPRAPGMTDAGGDPEAAVPGAEGEVVGEGDPPLTEYPANDEAGNPIFYRVVNENGRVRLVPVTTVEDGGGDPEAVGGSSNPEAVGTNVAPTPRPQGPAAAPGSTATQAAGATPEQVQAAREALGAPAVGEDGVVRDPARPYTINNSAQIDAIPDGAYFKDDRRPGELFVKAGTTFFPVNADGSKLEPAAGEQPAAPAQPSTVPTEEDRTRATDALREQLQNPVPQGETPTHSDFLNPANENEFVRTLSTRLNTTPEKARTILPAFRTPENGFLDPETPNSTQQAPARVNGALPVITDQTERVVNENGYGDRITGSMTVNGNTYQFASGGSGRGSIPFGTYRVLRFTTGAQRAQEGYRFRRDAFMLTDANDPLISDDQPNRQGLLIHSSGQGITAGCIGIVGGEEVFQQFIQDMQAEIGDNYGSFVIQVGPNSTSA